MYTFLFAYVGVREVVSLYGRTKSRLYASFCGRILTVHGDVIVRPRSVYFREIYGGYTKVGNGCASTKGVCFSIGLSNGELSLCDFLGFFVTGGGALCVDFFFAKGDDRGITYPSNAVFGLSLRSTGLVV